MGRRYGESAGNPDGYPEILKHCVEDVFRDAQYVSSQCSRKRGHGPDGLYCRQHGKMAEKRKQEVPDA